ncbi:DUF5994 family protein [Nocardia thraciensis]
MTLRADTGSDAYLDGAWWPRSGDLTTELPSLLAVLAIRLGPIQRVVYDHASWSPAPAETTIGGRAVRLDAYPFEAGNTMYVFGSDSTMLVLHVLLSTADPDTARATLMTTVAR